MDEDKNPADKDGRTPLHMVAYNHNGAFCEFIAKLAEKKIQKIFSEELWNEASKENGCFSNNNQS